MNGSTSLPSLHPPQNGDQAAGPNHHLRPLTLGSLMWEIESDPPEERNVTEAEGGQAEGRVQHRRSKRGRGGDTDTGDSLSDAERARRGLTVGMVLQCRDMNGGSWFKATVIAIRNNTFKVKYLGDTFQNIPFEDAECNGTTYGGLWKLPPLRRARTKKKEEKKERFLARFLMLVHHRQIYKCRSRQEDIKVRKKSLPATTPRHPQLPDE